MSSRTTEFSAQITGDANGAVAALEKVKVRVQETAKAAETANQKVAGSTDVLVKQSEKAAKGVASITQALYAMEAEGSARLLALGSAVGNFADLLGPGGKLVSGTAIVASSIVALFLQAKEKAAEATKAMEDDIKRLVNAADFATITKRLQEIERGTAGEGFTDGRSAIRERIRQLTDEASAVGKSSRFYRERQSAIIEEKKKLNELNAEYDRYFKALTDPKNAPAASRGLAGQPIVATADSIEKTTREANKSKEALDRAANAFDEAFAASLLGTAAAIEEAERAIEERQAKLQKALADESALRRTNNEETQREIAALLEGAGAYERYLIVQAQAAAVLDAEQRAKEANITLTEEQIQKIREEIADRLRLQKVQEALKSLGGQNPFSLPTKETFDGVGRLADDMSRAASAASGIAAAFGDAGRRMAGILSQSANLLTNLNRVQRAGIFTDASGKEQNVGAVGALRGAAGSAGTTAAVTGLLGAFGAGVGIISAWNSSAKAAADQAKATAVALRELGQSAKASVRNIELQATGTPLERELAGLQTQFRGIITSLLAAGAPRVAGLDQRTAVSTRPTAEDVEKAIAAYDKLVAAALRAAEFAARQGELEDDARLLAAQGQTAAAAAIRQLAANEKELEEARLSGADVAKKVAIQEAEAAQREAERLRKQQSVASDVAGRRASLNGDERGAFVQRQTSFSNSALAEAQALFDAGTITAELFAELKDVIGDELVDAIADFDAAAALAAKRVQDNIAVRTLEAQGRGEEAAALRKRLENEEELRNAADEATREQLRQLQALEAASIAAAEALEAAAEAAAEAIETARAAREASRSGARNRVSLFDLTGTEAFTTTLQGFGTAFSNLFSSFDLDTLGGIEGAKETLRGVFGELDKLSDAEILTRFGMTREEVVSALLDTDSGLDGLATALGDVATAARQAAQEAAEFSAAVSQDFLRSQGRGREADIAAATAKRDDRLRQASSLGLGKSVLAQIEAIYQADLAEINARYATAATAAAAAVPAGIDSSSSPSSARAGRGNATSLTQDFGGLSEITGQSLAGLLREVAINTSRDGAIVDAIIGRGPTPSLSSLSFPSFAGGAGGAAVMIGPITVNIGSMSPGALSPVEAAREVTQQITRELGRIASSEARFLGSARRA